MAGTGHERGLRHGLEGSGACPRRSGGAAAARGCSRRRARAGVSGCSDALEDAPAASRPSRTGVQRAVRPAGRDSGGEGTRRATDDGEPAAFALRHAHVRNGVRETEVSARGPSRVSAVHGYAVFSSNERAKNMNMTRPAAAPDPTAAPSAPTPLALRAPSVRADTAPFTRLDPTMPHLLRHRIVPLFGVKYFCRSTSTILAGFGRLLVRRRTVRWALLRVLKTQKTKRRERPLGDVHGVR